MLIDTHCHLDELTPEELKGVLQRAKDVGVGKMVTIGAQRKEFELAQKLAEDHDEIYFTIGIHPDAEEDFNESMYNDLIEFSKHPKCIGIGETGLDYSYDNFDKEGQKESFIRHIKACQVTGLPLIIHNRGSDEDMMEIMDEYCDGSYKVVFHCFSSGIELAKWAIEKDFYLSISGIVTFKNGQNVRDAVELCPIDRLMVETDAPYLSPEPYRGKKCEPAYVRQTFRKVAQIKGLFEEGLEKQLEKNFKEFFNV